jgi:hypothetical protein
VGGGPRAAVGGRPGAPRAVRVPRGPPARRGELDLLQPEGRGALRPRPRGGALRLGRPEGREPRAPTC